MTDANNNWNEACDRMAKQANDEAWKAALERARLQANATEPTTDADQPSPPETWEQWASRQANQFGTEPE